MKKFQIKHIGDIPLEDTHDLPDSRKTLATSDDLITNNVEAMTKGFLKPGQVWDWHSHDDYDELGVVLSGNGKFYWEDEVVDYKAEDVIVIPAGSKHKFEGGGDLTSEFYFIRVKV
jgi:quercetin dioxygenase-like cupin family protein